MLRSALVLFPETCLRRWRAKEVKDWIQERNVNIIEWPAQSPDLNTMENLWQIIGQKVSAMKLKIKAELTAKFGETWTTISKEQSLKMVNTMLDRCHLVINNNGWPIKY